MEEQWNLFGLVPYKIKKPIRLIELFGGIGSQAKALENLKANFETYRLCEFDKYAIASYNAVHHTQFETSDITKIHAKDLGIVDTDKYDYIMCYSFPCQDLSLAGLTKGMKKGSSTRSGLLWQVERLLKECDELPQVLVLENVTQVHNLKNANDFEDWCKFLNSLGYMNYWEDLNAKDYGIPQNRERTIMVSILGDYSYEFPKKKELKLRLKDLLEDNVDEKYFLSDKMINYISANNEKWTGNNDKALINKTIASTLNTNEGSRRCDASNYISKDVGDNYNLKTDKIIEECNLYNLGIKQYNRRTGSVVNPKGISSTLLARTAGDNNLVLDNKPSININEATKKGYAKAYEGDGVYINRPHQKRGVVQHNMIQTIKANNSDIGVVVKGQYNNKALNETLEKNIANDGDFIDSYNRDIRKDGIAGTITTRVSDSNNTFIAVKEDMLKRELCNKLIKEGKVEEGDVVKHSYTQQILDGNKKCVEKSDGIMITLTTRPDCVGVAVKDKDKSLVNNPLKGKTKYGWHFEQQVYDENGITRTIKAGGGSGNIPKVISSNSNLRIRKLTPKECWRLMGFDDEDYENAARVNSNAQLYKQAGNSIVVNVLMAVFKQLL